MNKIILSGRLTADPEMKNVNGITIASYSLAVQRDFKNKEGKYDTDFFRCQCFNKTAEFAEKYLKKGMKVLIEGRVQLGSYDKDGVKHYTTDVIVATHEFCESKNAAASAPSEGGSKVDMGFMNIPDNLPEEGLPF